MKYTDNYTGLIHPAISLYLPYTNRYTDCVRPDEGSLYRKFHAVSNVAYFLTSYNNTYQTRLKSLLQNLT